MKGERLQLRIDPKLKARAMRVVSKRNITLSALVTELLLRAVVADELLRKVGPGGEADQI